MGPEHFYWGGWWIFPTFMPLMMIVALVAVLYFMFGRGGDRPAWWKGSDRLSDSSRESETAMEILKKRYAKGEITREEFEQMKKDLLD